MTNIIQGPLDATKKFIDKTGALELSTKVVSHGINVSNAVAQAVFAQPEAYAPLTHVKDALGTFSGVIGAFDLVGDAHGFICKGSNNDYSWKVAKKDKELHQYEWQDKTWSPEAKKLTTEELVEKKQKFKGNQFQDDGYWSISKLIAKILKPIPHAIELVKLLSSFQFFSLGDACNMLSPVFILSTVKSIIYLPISILEIADSTMNIHMTGKYVDNARKKSEKWDKRPVIQTREHRTQLLSKYNKKLIDTAKKITTLNVRERLKSITDAEKQAIKEQVTLLSKKSERWSVYKEELIAAKVGQVLGENTQLRKDCEWKKAEWSKVVDMTKENAGKVKTVNWMNIAISIAKFSLGIISLAGIFTGLLVNPLFSGAVAVGWLGVYVLLLSKSIYSSCHSIKPIKKPHLIKVTAAAA